MDSGIIHSSCVLLKAMQHRSGNLINSFFIIIFLVNDDAKVQRMPMKKNNRFPGLFPDRGIALL